VEATDGMSDGHRPGGPCLPARLFGLHDIESDSIRVREVHEPLFQPLGRRIGGNAMLLQSGRPELDRPDRDGERRRGHLRRTLAQDRLLRVGIGWLGVATRSH